MNDRFLSLFFEEAHELLQALEAGLMDLEERQGDREHLDRTFRAAHTLKGAAGMVGLRPIADFTHKVEAVLDDIRAGRMAVTRGAITILLRAKDYLGTALNEAAHGRMTESPADLDEAAGGPQGEGRTRHRSTARTHARALAGIQARFPARGEGSARARSGRPIAPGRTAIGSSFAPGSIFSARGSTPSGSSTNCVSWATLGLRSMPMPFRPWRT